MFGDGLDRGECGNIPGEVFTLIKGLGDGLLEGLEGVVLGEVGDVPGEVSTEINGLGDGLFA